MSSEAVSQPGAPVMAQAVIRHALRIAGGVAVPFILGDDAWSKLPNIKRLVDEINARPAAQKANTLKDRHKFKTEMDQEALHAMFPHLKEKVA